MIDYSASTAEGDVDTVRFGEVSRVESLNKNKEILRCKSGRDNPSKNS